MTLGLHPVLYLTPAPARFYLSMELPALHAHLPCTTLLNYEE